MFFPKNRKFKKSKKLISKGTEFRTIDLKFGFFGLKSLSNGLITSKHIETARQAINRKIRPFGKIWIRVFAYTPVTSIPLKVRMGKGKGNISYWATNIKKGQIVFEIAGVSEKRAVEALKIGGLKLPLNVKTIKY
jgi:large subunit ribosomal protein L16